MDVVGVMFHQVLKHNFKMNCYLIIVDIISLQYNVRLNYFSYN